MDAEERSIFDELSSPALSLLDSRPVPQPKSDEMDFVTLADPFPDWDRALFHPLPPPVPVAQSVPPRNQHNFAPPLAWLDSGEPPQQLLQNLHVSGEDDKDSVDDKNSVDDVSPVRSHLKSSATLPLPVKPSSSSDTPKSEPMSPDVRGNVSHTRRCRAKVNNNFERLLDALPPPPDGVEVKHKAQILAYAIEHFRMIRCQNMKLEMQLALSSPYQMHRWVRSVVSSAPNLSEALKPFMALICLTRKWKYAELWMPYTHHGSEETTALKYITGALPPTVEGDELMRLRTYRKHSRRYVFRPRSGVPGRVFLTMRPEWLPLLNDPVAFPRAPHAVRYKVEVTFAVPVIVNGSVQMVVEFYDTARRDYDPEVLNMANEIAVLFGRAYAGQQNLAH